MDKYETARVFNYTVHVCVDDECCSSMTQTSKNTPVISGLRTSPFSFDCKEEHLDQHKQKSCHCYERHHPLFRYKQEDMFIKANGKSD